jgi:hypothetical protein
MRGVGNGGHTHAHVAGSKNFGGLQGIVSDGHSQRHVWGFTTNGFRQTVGGHGD